MEPHGGRKEVPLLAPQSCNAESIKLGTMILRRGKWGIQSGSSQPKPKHGHDKITENTGSQGWVRWLVTRQARWHPRECGCLLSFSLGCDGAKAESAHQLLALAEYSRMNGRAGPSDPGYLPAA